jgi:hypothetical protein
MNERRAIPRHKVLKAGSVASPFGIPHEVTLNILTQHARQHSYIVWRKERRMGVTFA